MRGRVGDRETRGRGDTGRRDEGTDGRWESGKVGAWESEQVGKWEREEGMRRGPPLQVGSFRWGRWCSFPAVECLALGYPAGEGTGGRKGGQDARPPGGPAACGGVAAARATRAACARNSSGGRTPSALRKLRGKRSGLFRFLILDCGFWIVACGRRMERLSTLVPALVPGGSGAGGVAEAGRVSRAVDLDVQKRFLFRLSMTRAIRGMDAAYRSAALLAKEIRMASPDLPTRGR